MSAMESFHEYEEKAARTRGAHADDRSRLTNYSLGLAGEVGEITDHLKKVWFHDHPMDRDHLLDEAGDLLWYLAMFVRTLGSSLSDVASRNIEKLEKRYPDGFSPERSKRRVI